jgi:hypothetical protein
MSGYGTCVPVVAATVCPHPPLLVPDLATGAASELDDLRSACRCAIDALLASDPDSVVVVGDGPRQAWFGPGEYGSLRPWGVAVYGQLGGRAAQRTGEGSLPLSLTVGGWLLGPVAAAVPVGPALPAVRGLSVRDDTAAEECATLGVTVAASGERVALLVMADGSATRSEKAPGYYDPRAKAFDAAVAQDLAAGDPEGLSKVDAGVAAELRCTGRAALQVMAGACAGRSWLATLRYDGAPYGVGYFVASWT